MRLYQYLRGVAAAACRVRPAAVKPWIAAWLVEASHWADCLYWNPPSTLAYHTWLQCSQ